MAKEIAASVPAETGPRLHLVVAFTALVLIVMSILGTAAASGHF